MKKLFTILILLVIIFGCRHNIAPEKTKPVDDSGIVPPGGFSTTKRPENYSELQAKGKPVKNGVITNLTATAISPYQIRINFSGYSGANYYSLVRNDSLIQSSIITTYNDYGLIPGVTYKYQILTSGGLSSAVYATTFSVSGNIIVFLQFNRDTTDNPAWVSYNNGQPLITEGSGLIEEERQAVKNGIAAKYSRFTKYVFTTNKLEYDVAPKTRRIKTIFTQTWSWYGQVGGVTYPNSLGVDIPNFVFTSLLSYNINYIIVAGAHEDGHSIAGLNHAVLACGDGVSGCNPMAAPYGCAVSEFVNHQLINNCSFEDQIDILSSK